MNMTMSQLHRRIALTFTVLALLFTNIPLAEAQGPTPTCTFGRFEVPLPGFKDDPSGEGKCISDVVEKYKVSGEGKLSPLWAFVSQLANIIIAVIVSVGLIAVVVGGYVYMTAGGNAQRISSAKTIVASALLGIMLALASFIILNTINPSLVGL